MNRNAITTIFVCTLLVSIAGLSARILWSEAKDDLTGEFGSFLKNTSRFEKTNINPPVAHFEDQFSMPATLRETGSLSQSASNYWWVNSGAELAVGGGTGRTLEGDLSESDPWRTQYARNNPQDTDNGLHPQNIFRLVQTDTWNNFSQSAYFKVSTINKSSSPNRNASNGIFLFNRYETGDNLYYAGIRVDGTAVIKKKIDGIYYTMASAPLFSGPEYDRDKNPNLLPLDRWIGVASEVFTNPDESVTVRLYTDTGSGWTPVLSAQDSGTSYGGAPITASGYAGIRTDFMDVEFRDYRIDVL